MRIAGLQKLTLLDFPEHMAATLFCPGCDFRCPFCHNASLVVPGREGFPAMDLDEIRAFLHKRRGVLDGVCITGGEPLLQPDIADFCAELKNMGFAVKLDTNGSFPATLEQLVERGLVDYVAMDMKAAVGIGSRGNKENSAANLASSNEVSDDASGIVHPTPYDGARFGTDASDAREEDSVGEAPLAAEELRFARVAGIAPVHARSLMASVGESATFLMRGLVPYEFRTTVVRELHDAAHLAAIASDIRGARAWYLQAFVDSDGVIGGRGTFHAYSSEEMHALAHAVRSFVPSVQVRGVD